METFRLTQKIRPLRLLLLISENTEDQALFAFQLNSALWGGMNNPIVSIEQGEEYLESVFEGFHVDYGINLSGKEWPTSIADKYKERLMPLEGYVGLIDRGETGYQFRLGCDIFPLCIDYWERHGKYQTLAPDPDEEPFLFFEGANDYWRKYASFVTGIYPSGFEYDYKDRYSKATKCQHIVLKEDNLGSFSFLRVKTPLGFTLANTRFYYPPGMPFFDSHILYIGDMGVIRHWLEFWNLRSCGVHILFVPWDKITEFSTHINGSHERRS